MLEEEAATVTKRLFVRLITKGCKIIVCLFVGERERERERERELY